MDSNSLDKNRVPEHVAIIMDGNGRWALKKGFSRLVGHENGVKSVRRVVEAAAETGVKFLTLYTFSKENWKRPAIEVTGLMTLLVKTIRKEIKVLNEQNIRLKTIGDISSMDKAVQKELNEAVKSTQDNSGLTLVLALNYSAKWDLVNATKMISESVGNGTLKAEDISENTIESYLSTNFMPAPELVIRTGGEYRISNFLLWESAYSELYFTKAFWPEFKKEDLIEAIHSYQNRERRFGKTSEQVINEK